MLVFPPLLLLRSISPSVSFSIKATIASLMESNIPPNAVWNSVNFLVISSQFGKLSFAIQDTTCDTRYCPGLNAVSQVLNVVPHAVKLVVAVVNNPSNPVPKLVKKSLIINRRTVLVF